MPSRDATQALEDIVANIQRIQRYVEGLSFEKYAADTRTVDAVERCLARISEAAVRLGDAASGLCPEVPWADIRGIGNHLRHAYETIDQRIVWRVVTRELASLLRASPRRRDRSAGCLEYVAEADAGDFIYVPPWVPHQEINARTDEPLECVLVRSDEEPVVVNLAIEPAEAPEEVRWIDPNHPQG